jgi:hypothetical protein
MINDEEKISEFIAKQGLTLAGAIAANPLVPNGYFIPLRVTDERAGRRTPSARTLAKTKNDLYNLEYNVEFILIEEKSNNIENLIRASLLASFPEHIRNSFYSQWSGKPQVWVEFKRQPDIGIKSRIEAHLEKFGELFSLPGLRMTLLGEIETATKLEVLAAVRQLAPIGPEALAEALRTDGLHIPSLDWTIRRLDSLRKSNLVLRRSDGAYVLTREALSRMGTIKGRRSPDIRRFLALARRGG